MNTFRLVLFVFLLIPVPLLAESRVCADLDDCMVGAACIDGVCQESGSLVFDARWTSGTDVDLHVMLPDGSVISPQIGDSRSAQGGRIRRDDCYQNCSSEGSYHEQIGWKLCQLPPAGTYRVWVENFNGLAAAEVNITLNSIVSQMDDITLRVDATEGASSEVVNIVVGQPDRSECISDTDQDGICDLWEVCGVDGDGDGIVDWRPRGADPYVKDVFVELDYQALHNRWSESLDSRTEVVEAAIADVETSFARAPVDGGKGVRLHMSLDEEVFIIDGESTVDNLVATPDTLDLVRFGRTDLPHAERTSCESGFYGTLEERKSPNCQAVIAAKRKVVRYGYLANQILADGEWLTGVGMVEPNDAFMTGLGRYEGRTVESDTFFTKEKLAAVLMHELGHTLGLEHGGHEDVNCKNNYFSVMNYLYMFDREGNRPLDYSRSVSLPLDPRAIVETHGVVTERPFRGLFWSNGVTTKYERRWHGSGMIDFDSDGAFEEQAQEIPVGHMPDIADTCGKVDPLGVLEGHDDWANLRFAIGLSTKTRSSERGVSFDTLAAIEAVKDDDGDEAVGLDDNCPGLANDQTDTDEDGVGDACDACPSRSGRGFEDGCPFGVDAVADGSPGASDGLRPTQSGGCSTGESEPTILLFVLLGLCAALRRRRFAARAVCAGVCAMALLGCNIEDSQQLVKMGGESASDAEDAEASDPWDVPDEAKDWYEKHANTGASGQPADRKEPTREPTPQPERFPAGIANCRLDRLPVGEVQVNQPVVISGSVELNDLDGDVRVQAGIGPEGASIEASDWQWWDGVDATGSSLLEGVVSSELPGRFHVALRVSVNQTDWVACDVDGTSAEDPAFEATEVLVVRTAPAVPQAPYRGLIISEVIEGSSYNKALEVHNATDEFMSLEGCFIDVYYNGSETVSVSYALDGGIGGRSFQVMCNSRFDADGMDPFSMCDYANGINFNGDDAIALQCSGQVVDVVGRIGEDPGDSWSSGGVSTQDQTLKRVCGVEEGDTNGSDSFQPDAQWVSSPTDDWFDLYYHCG